jgi:signal peptidase I
MSDKMKYFRDILITVVISIFIFLVLQFTIGTFRVYGTSMLPGILPDDYIIVSKVDYRLHKPERGDVIVLRSPRDQTTDLIKRIIAIPGDTIEIRNSQIFVNDKVVSEPYIKEAPNYKYPKQTLPEDNYFVLGDNRNVSSDSHIGWYAIDDDIIGKAWIVYWPFGRMQVIKHYKIQ